MNSRQSKVSGLLPIKNGANFIPLTIPSILSCLRSNDELVIVDDGSTDETQMLIQELRAIDGRIKYFTNPGKGIVDALNFGLIQTANDAIARFDIDDFYFSSRVEEQRKLLVLPVVAVFCDYSFIDREDRRLGVVPSAIFALPSHLSLITSQRTPHPGVLFSKKAAISVGAYRKQDEFTEDLSLWLRIARVGFIISVPKELFSYRLHNKSITNQFRKQIIHKKQNLYSEFPLPSTLITECMEEFQNFVNLYAKYDFAIERSLLLLRDISIASGRNLSAFVTKNFIYLMIRLGILNMFITIFRLIIERAKRNFLRFSSLIIYPRTVHLSPRKRN